MANFNTQAVPKAQFTSRVPLATACHVAKTSIMVKSVGAEKYEPLEVTAVAIHCSRHEMQYAL